MATSNLKGNRKESGTDRKKLAATEMSCCASPIGPLRLDPAREAIRKAVRRRFLLIQNLGLVQTMPDCLQVEFVQMIERPNEFPVLFSQAAQLRDDEITRCRGDRGDDGRAVRNLHRI